MKPSARAEPPVSVCPSFFRQLQRVPNGNLEINTTKIRNFTIGFSFFPFCIIIVVHVCYDPPFLGGKHPDH